VTEKLVFSLCQETQNQCKEDFSLPLFRSELRSTETVDVLKKLLLEKKKLPTGVMRANKNLTHQQRNKKLGKKRNYFPRSEHRKPLCQTKESQSLSFQKRPTETRSTKERKTRGNYSLSTKYFDRG
jgi:hypothetical protein